LALRDAGDLPRFAASSVMAKRLDADFAMFCPPRDDILIDALTFELPRLPLRQSTANEEPRACLYTLHRCRFTSGYGR